eukprot:jgi/Mesen1/1775/ME000014S01182
MCYSFLTPQASNFNLAWYDIIIALPSVLFLAFLISRFKPSVKKLIRSKSLIMTTYYVFLWVVCALNLIRVILEVWKKPGPGVHEFSWNVMWLVTRFGMVLLEMSVVVFLYQGYLISGWEALIRTVVISGLIAAAAFIMGWGVPLFITGGEREDWRKWAFWAFHDLLFAAIYLSLIVLPYTKWRDRLPARPAFYRYALLLCLLNLLAFLGSLLLDLSVDFGYCIYGLAGFTYYAFYPPLLYITFLADFFKEEEVQLEEAYYSEMKDAGYFDENWE